jgi:predicted nucleic acid-binding protein
VRVVVADTGPLHYLVLIGEEKLPGRLFGRVTIPDAVQAELRHPHAPALVRDWIASQPSWIDVGPAGPIQALPLPALGAGERAVIALAQSLRADLVLIDDRVGTIAARGRGLAAVGTLGLLDLAGRQGMVDVLRAVARLKSTNFRIRPEILDALLVKHLD